MKNPHAVALGRLGGSKGGHARARALSSIRRQTIARAGGRARARAMSAGERQELARRAAKARWIKRTPISAADAPPSVMRLLKTYDPAALQWARSDDRYAIVREILIRGDGPARVWLRTILRRVEVKALVREYRGAGCSEPERAQLRRQLRLNRRDVPARPYLGFVR